MSKQIPPLIQTFINKIHNSCDISVQTLNDIFFQIDNNNDNLYEKKINELRELCELHGLTKIGNKADLLQKLKSTTNPKTNLYLKSTSTLKDICKKNQLKVTGNKNQLVIRIYNHIDNDDDVDDVDDDQKVNNFIQNLCNINTDYSKLKKNELKQLCKDKNLDDTCTKSELLARLNNL